MRGKTKRNAKAKETQNVPPLNVSLPSGMSAPEMQSLIVGALLEYDQKKQEIAKQKEAEEANEWRRKIGYKDYSDRKFLRRTVLTFVNSVCVLRKVLFMRKERIDGDFATVGLMRIALSATFSIAKLVLWVISAAGLLIYPISLIVPSIPKMTFPSALSYIAIGLTSLLFAQLFRIAGIEIEKMKDRDYVVEVFAAVAAVVAIIVSVVLR